MSSQSSYGGTTMLIRYYVVSTKCGHVGRNNYITIDFAVKAINSKEASNKVRQFPRVKKHHKDVIESITEISKEEYHQQRMRNHLDPYLNATSKQEQNVICMDLEHRIKRHQMKEKIDYKYKRKNRINFLIKKRKIEHRLMAYF